MSGNTITDACGDIRFAGHPPATRPPGGDASQYTLPLPASNIESAQAFLEGLGGDAIGMGHAMNNVGMNAPLLRAQYKREIEKMMAEVERRFKAGESKEAIARWTVDERTRIAHRMRASSNVLVRGMYTIRDWRDYGLGGRTWESVGARYPRLQATPDLLHEQLIYGSQKSNGKVNNAAMRGASFLKHGGRVVLVVGISVTAARIWNSSEAEMPRVLSEELGGYVGGGVGAGLAASGCIIFGVASAGWGLLACGVIGGLAGGVAGSYAGQTAANGLFYTDAKAGTANLGEVQIPIELPGYRLYRSIPESMCYR